MRKLFLLCVLPLMILSVPAQASYWVACKVNADVSKDGTNYKIKVIKSAVVKGSANKGQSCFGGDGLTLTLPISEARLPVGSDEDLKYELYNSMGPNGAVSSVKWSKW